MRRSRSSHQSSLSARSIRFASTAALLLTLTLLVFLVGLRRGHASAKYEGSTTFETSRSIQSVSDLVHEVDETTSTRQPEMGPAVRVGASDAQDESEIPLPLTTVTFAMVPKFAEKWQTSSERLRFSTVVKIQNTYPQNDISDDGVSSDQELPHVSRGFATFYGKSSLKLKYTSRRSLEVSLENGFSLSDVRGNKYSVASDLTSHFLLLSLWEDNYRLAYVSSIELLKELGLFFSSARLVELRCSGLSEDIASDTHEVWDAPADSNLLDRTELTNDESVKRLCGDTLGVYLLLEYPSASIARKVSNLFAAVGRKISELHTTSHELNQRVCETDEAFRARSAALDVYASRSVAPSPIISTRNWMYFEKPPIYDVLDVPSFARNSSLSPIYRRMESTIRSYSSSSLAKGPQDGKDRQYFDLNLYLSWVAINTLLKNGDYDDEVFFYGVAPKPLVDSGSFQAAAATAKYFAVMAWDYDSVFSPCHRKGANAAKSELIFCGETPIEKLIARQLRNYDHRVADARGEGTDLAQDYLASLACVLGRVGTISRWKTIVNRNKLHLSRLLRRRSVHDATFAVEIERHKRELQKKPALPGAVPPSSSLFIEKGAAELISSFSENHRFLAARLKRLGFGIQTDSPRTEVLLSEKGLERDATEGDVDGAREAETTTPTHIASRKCPIPKLSDDADVPQNELSLFARKIVGREHKGATTRIANWINQLSGRSADKGVHFPSKSITFWLPDASSVMAETVGPQTVFESPGLYCLSATRFTEEDEVTAAVREDAAQCTSGANTSGGVVLLPFVVRGKDRGKAEYATPAFEKPPLHELVSPTFPTLAASAVDSAQVPTVLVAAVPLFWYGANTALSLPDDTSQPQDSRAFQGRRFPVILSAKQKADSSKLVKENYYIVANPLGGDASGIKNRESILLRGRSAMTVVLSENGNNLLDDERRDGGGSREGPFVVVNHDGNHDQLQFAISPFGAQDRGRLEVRARIPRIIPALGTDQWLSFKAFMQAQLNSDLVMKNAKRMRMAGDDEYLPEGVARPKRDRHDDSIPLESQREGKEAGLFLVVDATSPVTLTGESAVLIIPPGSVVLMKGLDSKIIVSDKARLIFNGTQENPISILAAPSSSAPAADARSPTPPSPWDTILVRKGGILDMRWCFVTGSGVRGRLERGTGKHHSHSSAITVVDEGSAAYIANSFFIYLYGAAMSSGLAGKVEVRDSVVQWAELGIECVLCDFLSEDSIWALFPSWTTSYADNDNDAMYLSGGNHVVKSSVIAHTKDDGIDTGTPEKFKGGDGGTLSVEKTIFEMITHEAIALSSAPKGSRSVTVADGLIQFAQQGIEMGYSGRGLEAVIERTVVRNCGVGARFGDNYRLPVEGSATFERVVFSNNSLHTMDFIRRSSSVGNGNGNGGFRFNRCEFHWRPDSYDEKSPCYRAVSMR